MAVTLPLVRCPTCGRSNRVPPAAHGAPSCGACGSALPWLVDSSEADFPTVVAESDLPVLVDFWAPWCAPCRVLSPLVERIGEDLRGKLKVVKVNTDENQGIATRFGIRGIPTLILFRRGQPVARQVGLMDAPALRRWVETALTG